MEPINNTLQGNFPPENPVSTDIQANQSTQTHPTNTTKRNNLGKIISIIIILILLSVSGVAGYFIYKNLNQSNPEQVACTMEAMICPDGSSVGRSGPNCEFAPCPKSESTSTPDTWQTKSISQISLSFKYPQDWEEKKTATGGVVLIGPKDNETTWIGINDSTYINLGDTPEKLSEQALGNETPTGKKQITIDGHNAVYQERRYLNSARIEVYIGEVKQMTNFAEGPRLTNGTQSVFMEIKDLSELDSSRKIFDQILSTFQFTN